MQALTRFLGDTPLRVAIRLIVLSFIVGFVLHVLGIQPWDVYYWARSAVLRIYDMGFAVFRNSFDYLFVGAIIVVPLFLLARLFRAGGRRRTE
jgi:hypothetical protein